MFKKKDFLHSKISKYFRLVFLLGMVSDVAKQNSVKQEAMQYKDIAQGVQNSYTYICNIHRCYQNS